MRKILLALGIMALICTPAMAGPNANGAIVVHTNDAYNYSAGTACTTTLGLPATCEEAILRSDKDFNLGQRSTVWFLAAFLPTASPRVASVYFGTDVDDLNFDVGSNYAPCAPSGSTTQVPDTGWPYDMGNSVGFGTPVLGNTLFRFYVFGVDNYDGDPLAPNPWWCSAINPTGGYAAFFDDMFPPNQDNITKFGCVKWYEAGYNQCPEIIPISGACCFATGECLVLMQADCVAQGGSYVGDDTVCLPNPCAQPGACCDLETGICRFVLQAACEPPFVFVDGSCEPNPCPQKGACCEPVTGVCTYVLADQCMAPNVWHGEWTCDPNLCPVEPQGACCDPATGACIYVYAAQCLPPMVWHPEWTCDPNYCPPPVATEPTTWGQIKANYR